jgi:hypothetical protein
MRRHSTGVDQRIKTGHADTATAFHAPESGSAAHGGENRQRSVDSHVVEGEGVTLELEGNERKS